MKVAILDDYFNTLPTLPSFRKLDGFDVSVWNDHLQETDALADGESVAASREAFFAESDVVTLHVRLKPSTQGIITLDDLLGMRADALFVNTSRAGLVAPGALLAALNAGHPGRAAVDVFDTEPLTDPADPLLAHPNLLATPHIGYVTEDELDLQFSDIYDQVLAFTAGSPINMINPEALERTAGA